MGRLWLIVTLCGVLTGCAPNTHKGFAPQVVYEPARPDLHQFSSSFSPLTSDEQQEDWAKELRIAEAFARDLDWYRAVTNFKRALILVPEHRVNRRLQVEYGAVLSYYLAHRYADGLRFFEGASLATVKPDFPAFRELVLILDDMYSDQGDVESVQKIDGLLSQLDPDVARRLEVSQAIRQGDVRRVKQRVSSTSNVYDVMDGFEQKKKSISRARILNGILPGAGYAYVEQHGAAATSFIINALFAAGAYQLFDDGNIGLGLFVTSLEAGWYIGGINGAGLAANEYNERLYEPMAHQVLRQEKLYPLLMFTHVF